MGASTGRSAGGRFVAWRLPIVVFGIGFLLSLLTFWYVDAREREARRVEFERRAARVAMTARISFDVPLEVLRSVPALFEASDEVTRADFHAFVADSLARYPWIYALEWIPRVPRAERARYEAAAAADGLRGYHFKEDAPSGPPVRARERAEYFPLYYMEPPNEIALGIEETALGLRKQAMQQARDTGETTATERLRLVQDDPSVVSVIAFHPVYVRGSNAKTSAERREHLRGFAAAVFRVRPVVGNALREVDLDAMDVALLDASASEPARVLFESRPGASQRADDTAGFEHAASIAGRRWVFRVTDRAGWVQSGTAGWSALLIGLVVSGLAAGLAYASSAMLLLRRQVHEARRLGQYTLVEKLGEGGMGTVYRAHHAMLRRPTAVKLLHPERSGSSALARFEREVQLTSGLTHPNTVVVYDYGHTENDVFYYAMEFIDGITLQELVDVYGPQPQERVVHILRQVCGSLAEAHAAGMVHRDVKPANVMLCNRGGLYDFAKVLDFGLVTDPSETTDGRLSQSSHVLGTPLYLSPEIIRGTEEVDARADIYALGALAYFLLTGVPVFSGQTVVEVCAKHLTSLPEPPTARTGAVAIDPALEALVMRCLAKDPADRPASASELLNELAGVRVQLWTTEDARAWWQDRGAGHGKPLPASRREPAAKSADPTLELFPRRRQGAGDAGP